MDGQKRRVPKRTVVHRNREKIQHRLADSEKIRGERKQTEIRVTGSEAVKVKAVQRTDRHVVRRSEVQCSTNPREVRGARVRSYMQEMGLCTIYPGPNLSKRVHESLIYPYLLRNVDIVRANQVWGTDITYIRMNQGFLYLVVFMDWYSRYVLSWELSDSLEVGFVICALENALAAAKPEILNSDQGSQFTSKEYTSMLSANDVRISMDGRGRCMDNIFTERLWRSLKYQEVYLKEYRSPREARSGIGDYFHKYNSWRPHQGLGGLTPADVFLHGINPF